MKNPALAALEKARDALKSQATRAEFEANEAKIKYEAALTNIRSLRRQLEGVENAIKSLGGVPEDVPYSPVGDEPLLVVLNAALREGPLTLADLRNVAESQGFSPYAVRKALSGLAYRHAKSGNKVLYALREANDPVLQ